MWFVYILRCADGSLYIGETRDLERRVAKHADGSASAFTAARRPIVLVHFEALPDQASALRRERQLKGWTRVKKEALIAGDLDGLKRV